MTNVFKEQKLQGVVEAFRHYIQQQGWLIRDEKVLNNGLQLRITDGHTKASVNCFTNGNALIQGSAGTLRTELQTWWKQQRNHSALPLLWEEALLREGVSPSVKPPTEERTVAKRIGVHEAGNDDYFGPLVIVGLYVDEGTEARLIELGVRDSTWLPDNIIFSLAEAIKEVCRGRGHHLVYQPQRYNTLYQELSNVDLLRAKAYAHVIAKLQEQHPSEHAAVNVFSDEALVPKALQDIGCHLPVKQGADIVDDASVAAAYILARAEFVQYISTLSQQCGVQFPKGNSHPDILTVGREIIAHGGQEALGRVAKLHFEMTQQI